MKALVKGNEVPFSPGIHRGKNGMNREQYDGVGAFNQSLIKLWVKTIALDGGCPKKFRHLFLSQREKERSDALIMGAALDTMILEEDEFEEKFIIIPDDAPKRPSITQVNAKEPSAETKKIVAWWQTFEKKAAGKDQLTQKQHQTLLSMHGAVTEKDGLVSDVFQYCEKAVLQAEINGMPCKGEVDLFCENTEFLFDLKTTADAGRVPFGKSAWEYGYHYQAAFYLKLAQELGLNKTSFCFVAVENVAPYCVAAYTIDFTSDALQYAWKQTNAAMPSLRHHFTTNQWPDHGDFVPLKLPGFSKYEILDFAELF